MTIVNITNMINHQQFLDKWLGKRYRETPELGFQCAWFCKLYFDEVYGVRWLSFGGSALTGWQKKWNLQDILDIVTQPQVWDMVFFDKTPTNPYWHVWIYHDQKTLLEQNGWQGGSTGLGKDAIRLAKMPKGILGYMRQRESETDKRVRLFADKYDIKGRSKTEPYTQYEVLILLSKLHP